MRALRAMCESVSLRQHVCMQLHEGDGMLTECYVQCGHASASQVSVCALT